MTHDFTDDQVRAALDLYAEPLTGISETEQEWVLGSVGLSKFYCGYSVGYSYKLPRGATFTRRWFDVDGARGWALIFNTLGTPPSYFAGWVPEDREQEAQEWIGFLNEEIEKRHRGLDSRDPHDGSASQEYEHEEELRKAERIKGVPPSKLVR